MTHSIHKLDGSLEQMRSVATDIVSKTFHSRHIPEEIALVEAMTNAITHGRAAQVSVAAVQSEIKVCVQNTGPAIPISMGSMTKHREIAQSPTSGFGLQIMAKIASRLDIQRVLSNNYVTLTFHR